MYVGLAKIGLLIGDSHSLKDKRMVLRRIKDRVRERLHVVVNEVGDPEIRDSWNRAELGVAIASGDRGKALALVDEVVRVAVAAGGAQVATIAKDVVTFDAPPAPYVAVDDRTGSGDKAAAAASDDWVPEEWQRDE
ncbi:MAG TPA: DUF503 domain-containing protein [Kofleriaceae bacterium]|nr:DUF503 domain-containing protein [Kofleriaceae bacterium]